MLVVSERHEAISHVSSRRGKEISFAILEIIDLRDEKVCVSGTNETCLIRYALCAGPSERKVKLIRKEPIPSRAERPVMGCRTDKNFVRSNAIEVKEACPPPQPGNDSFWFTSKPGFGKVPAYLERTKQQLAKEKADIDAYLATQASSSIQPKPSSNHGMISTFGPQMLVLFDVLLNLCVYVRNYCVFHFFGALLYQQARISNAGPSCFPWDKNHYLALCMYRATRRGRLMSCQRRKGGGWSFC